MPTTLPAAHRARSLALAAPFCLVAAGCNVPNFEGPQIQSPPPAFTMKREVTEERPMFPDRAVVYHDAWVEASWGNFSGIYINGHPGVLGSAEVEGARRSAMAAAEDQRVEFGEVESLQVDGRTALGWGETWRLANGGLQYVVFRAAIPYDTITYAVDFLTGEPGLKSRPDSLRTIVASFAVGKTTWNMPLIMILAGVVLLVGNLARSRSKARAERHRHVPLVTIPKKEGTTPAGPAAAAGARASQAPPSGPAAPGAAKGGAAAPPSSVAEQIAKTLEQKRPPPRS